MRKLALILAVLMAFGGVAFASDVTVSGGIDHAWGFGGEGFYSAPRNRADVNVSAQVDEINSVGITMRYNIGASANVTTVVIENAHFSTNLGAALGLDGMSLVTKVGWYEASDFDAGKVTGIALERAARRNLRSQHIQLDYAFGDLLSFRGVITPGEGDALDGMVAISGGAGPVMAGLSYTDYSDSDSANEAGKGLLRVGVTFSEPALVPDTVGLSVGANFAYDLDADAETQAFWGVGVNANLLGGLANLGIGYTGNADAAAEALSFELGLSPVAFAGVDASLTIDLREGAEAFSYMEASAYLKPGAATFRLGVAMAGKNTKVDDDGDTVLDAFGTDRNAGGVVAPLEKAAFFFRATIGY